MGVVARDLVERDGQDDADQAGPGRSHVEPVGAEAGPERQAAVDQAAQGLWVLLVILWAKVQVEEAQDHEAHDAENRAQDESVVDRVECLVAGAVRAGLDGGSAPDRAQDADGPDQEREDDPLVAEAGVAQDHGRDDGHLIAFKDVGGHAGAVADVVADVVGDRGGVAGVILRDAGLDLAHQVGTDIGRLGVNAAADSHEQCQQGSSEAKAQQDFVSTFTVGHEDERAPQEAQAVGEHAGDRAGAVTQLQSGTVAGPRSGGDPQITPHRQAHPHEADQPGERRSHEKGGRPAKGHLLGRLGRGPEQSREHNHQRGDRLELPGQIGVGSLADRRADLAHSFGALVGTHHLIDQTEGINQTRDRDAQDNPKRDFLPDAISRVGREPEVMELFLVCGQLVPQREVEPQRPEPALEQRPSWPPLVPAAARALRMPPVRESRTE